MYITKDTSFS